MANVKLDLMNLGMSPELSNYLGTIIGAGDSDEWIFTTTTYTIHANTSNNADSAALYVCGGGSAATSRGATITLRGNEQVGGNGGLELVSGNVSAGYVYISALGASSSIQLLTNSAERWRLNASGDLVQESTNGGNIYLSKAGTAIRQPLQTGISAAGTIITDATDLTSVHSVVTTTAASTGVQLWDAPVGSVLTVVNRGANTLKVYPSSGSDAINTLGAGNPASLTAGLGGFFIRNSSTTWAAVSGDAL